MTICPVAIAVGCQKCPALKLCPLKSLLGDQPKAPSASPVAVPRRKPGASATKGASKRAAPGRKKSS